MCAAVISGGRQQCSLVTRKLHTDKRFNLSLNSIAKPPFVQMKSQNKIRTNVSMLLTQSLMNIFVLNGKKKNCCIGPHRFELEIWPNSNSNNSDSFAI